MSELTEEQISEADALSTDIWKMCEDKTGRTVLFALASTMIMGVMQSLNINLDQARAIAHYYVDLVDVTREKLN